MEESGIKNNNLTWSELKYGNKKQIISLNLNDSHLVMLMRTISRNAVEFEKQPML